MTQRILHLIPNFEGGGAERQVGYLCAGLVELGWDVHVGHLGGGPNLERVRASGATLHRLPAASNYDPRLVWRCVKLIRSVAPIAVQTWLPMMDVVGGTAALITGVPWIMSERCDGFFDRRHSKMRLRRQFARGATAIVSNSSGANAYWMGKVSEHRCSVIPNALPLDEIESTTAAKRSTFDLPEDAPLIVYVGRFDPGKNINTMLDALEQVVAKSDARALLCGNGPLLATVEDRVANGVLRDRVLTPGFVSNPWSWLKAADLFISVSLSEGMPNTVMEAMAAGCAVVVSDIPHHREVLDSSAARFVPVDDASAIADAILADLRDPERDARAATAKQRAQSWSIPAAAQRWASFYEELAAPTENPSPGGAPP